MRIANVSLNVRPWLPTQRKVLESCAKYLCYIGGVGCGKTVVTVSLCVILCLEYPRNRVVLDSPTFPKLKDDVIPVMREIIPSELLYGGDWRKAYHGTDHDLRFANESVINCRSPMTHEQIRGPTIGAFAMIEAGARPVEIFNAYRGRLRKPGVRLLGMVDSNPAAESHWMHEKFVDQVDADPINTYELFQASSRENIYNPDGYLQDLEKWGDDWRRMYLEGNWGKLSGQIYDLVPEIHYVEPRDFYRHVWDDARDFWNFGVGVDPAENQPTAAWFKFHDEDGNSWYVDRYSREGTVTSEHAKNIIQISREWGRNADWRQGRVDVDAVGDPSIANARAEGISWADIYNANGLFVRPAESCRGKDKVRWGIGYCKQRLFIDPLKLHPINGRPGAPKIFFVLTDRVKEGLPFITSYRWSSATASGIIHEDKPHKYQDHDPDALRYRECEVMETPRIMSLASLANARYRREVQSKINPMTGYPQR